MSAFASQNNELPESTRYARYQGDICITGMSGRVGQCKDLDEFKEMLWNKKDAFTDKPMRFNTDKYNKQKEHAYMEDTESFDSDYFGIAPKNAEYMDPHIRLNLERSYEAIIDAGYSMPEVRGTVTGVYVSAGHYDSVTFWQNLGIKNSADSYKGLGTITNFRATRTSYCMDLRGPSYTIDTACSGYLAAIDAAIKDIRLGNCCQALVAGIDLQCNPLSSETLFELGLLGENSRSFSFDEKAEGFARGEAAGVLFLQKEEDARRIHAKFVHSFQNSDGKSGGLDFNTPSLHGQINSLTECYRQADVDPQKIEFVETHGLGVKNWDTTEANAVTEVFCGKRRAKPLMIGSVKTNVGHAEAASGFNSVAKCVFGMKEGVIPPNINFENPSKDIPGLHDGRLAVPTELTPWSGELCGINAYSFGGNNAHVILKKNDQPKKKTDHPASRSPRIFTYCARTEAGLENILDNVQKNAHNVGFQALLQSSSNESFQKMPFRGYTVLNTEKPVTDVQPSKKRPIVFSCTGMGCQWAGMGKRMMEIELFRESVQKSCEILKKNHQIDLYEAMKNGTEQTLNGRLGSMLNIPIMQVALVDMLTALGIKPDFIIGHSLGEVTAGYADGCLTREEAMLVPFGRYKAATSTTATEGQMAAVGMSLEELEKIVPSDIDLGCHNGADSVTISGPTASVQTFIKALEKKSIFAKAVDSGGYAFHSRLIRKSEGEIRRQMTMGGLVGKPRTSRWLSSAYPKSKWGLEEAKVAGVDYYAHNYCNRVRFYDVVKMLPKDAIVIEIAPSGLLQSALKKALGSDGFCTALMKRNNEDNIAFFLQSLGNMYCNGVDMKPLNMFQQKVSFPVSQETPLLSPMISKQWSHTETFRIPHIDDLCGGNVDANEAIFNFAKKGNGHYLFGHKLNGVKVFPTAGYLSIAWETLAAQHGTTFDKFPIVFEDVNILRRTPLPEKGKLTFSCRIKTTGEFHVTEDEELVAKGKIFPATDAPKTISAMKELDGKIKSLKNTKNATIPQTQDEIYLGFVNKGLDYSGPFRGILKTDGHGMDVEWRGQWIAFLEAHLQAGMWMKQGDSHIAPLKMDAIFLDASKLQTQLCAGVEKPVFKVMAESNNMNYITSDVFKVKQCEWDNTDYQPSDDAYLEEVRFVPYIDNTPVNDEDLQEYAEDCVNFAVKCLEKALKSGNFPHLSNNKDVVDDARKVFWFKSSNSSDEDLSKACKRSDCGLAKTLKEMFPSSGKLVSPKGVSDIITSNKTELTHDRLIDSLSSPGILNAALEIVKFNFPDGKHTVFEVDAGSSRMYRHITPYLLAPDGINYTATDKDVLPNDLKEPGMNAVKWDLASGSAPPNVQASLMVLKNVLHNQKDVTKSLNKLLPCVVPGGFILVQEVTNNFPLFVALEGLHQSITLPSTDSTREYGRFFSDSTLQTYFTKQGLDLIYKRTDGLLSTMYLLRKKQSVKLETKIVRLEKLDPDWFENLKKEMKELEDAPKDSGKRLLIMCETMNSGVVGLTQCLRKERGGDKVRLHFDSNLDNKLGKAEVSEGSYITEVTELDLYQNVYRDCQWGFFARKPLDHSFRNTATASDAYVSIPTKGDPSSATWVNSSRELLAMDDFREQGKDSYVTVHYAGVNDRDILQANGQIPKTDDLVWRFNHGVYGYEFAGSRENGTKVIGLVPGLALATGLNHRRGIVFDVPEKWTMKDAATVPYCYLSVYYALVVREPLCEGQTILVHSGATAMGTAAISTALHKGATVYTTVYTEEEKKYLKKRFPQLAKSHVIYRTGKFSVNDGIQDLTGCQGVDIILSPYADESLYEESFSSLDKSSGQYIEIGRPVSSKAVEDFATKLLSNNMVYTRVDAMVILNDKASHKRLIKYVSDDMEKGVIKPINATIFEARDISKAFTEASESRLLGKVLVQIREEEFDEVSKPKPVDLPVSPRVTCDPKKVYILCGGLGGIGLELAHWLVQRGARNVVLTSRRGITTGYQEYKKRMLEENYKANIKVITTKLTSTADAKKLLQQAQPMGPVGGIFILSMVLNDKYFSKLTKETFAETAFSKINDTIFMDEASRELCGPELDWFVAFSSVTSGIGNVGQTNYGFGNSVMERTCEKRKADGHPGLAIQWGVIDDVGVFMAGNSETCNKVVSNFEAMGVGLQRIASCLHALDTFLLLKKENVVGSIKSVNFSKCTPKEDAVKIEQKTKAVQNKIQDKKNVQKKMYSTVKTVNTRAADKTVVA